MRCNDYVIITQDKISQAPLDCMEKHKMLIKRIDENNCPQWLFRHQSIMDFFITKLFLRKEDENKQVKHIDDVQFRGVYFLLANFLPENEADNLKDLLINHAVDTKNHSISDEFIKKLRGRKKMSKLGILHIL